jgi:Polysaccharide pyruvyl transferase
MDWRASHRIAFSGYIGKFSAEVDDLVVFQNRAAKSTYILQDEHMFYGLTLDSETDPVYNDMSGYIRSCKFNGMEKCQDVDLRIFVNTHQWRAMISSHDACFGKRFHGVVAGLQAGVPGLMVAVDDRMREMITQLGLPFIEGREWGTSADKLNLICQTTADFSLQESVDLYSRGLDRFEQRLAGIGLGREDE